ncbi:hypothetical protein SteCoe_32567 [Stentor coeruleus]|uniref:EF-hand domain-containing protein n=1 Tax=Stentor coeruleus TaxID=5963 RepID=A0A1R2AYS4_9CILI|nr:hypothetical protein SteCoe_32567 [Stentor coeruleus]
MASGIVKQILAELNQCRDDPRKYSNKLTSSLKYYKGKIYHKPERIPLETREGPENVEACSSYLKSLRPLHPLKWSNSLYLSAQEHADDIGPKGMIGHNSSDGKEPAERISSHCKWSGALGENISYGLADAEDIVISMLADDGVLARGQRLNIMKRDHNYVGIAIGKHNEYEIVCVIVFAEEIKNDEELVIGEQTPLDVEEVFKKYTLRKMRTIEAFETFDIRNYEKPGLSENKLREIKGLFDFFDSEDIGAIDVDDLKSIAEMDDLEISNMTAFQKAFEIESVGKKYGFKEFLELMTENSNVSMSYSQSEVNEKSMVLAVEKKNFRKPPLAVKKEIKDICDISSLTDEEIVNIKEYFDVIDNNTSGVISSDSFRSFLESKIYEKTSSDIANVINDINPTDIEGMDFSDFLGRLADKIMSSRKSQESLKKLPSLGSELNSSISSSSSTTRKAMRRPKEDAYECRKTNTLTSPKGQNPTPFIINNDKNHKLIIKSNDKYKQKPKPNQTTNPKSQSSQQKTQTIKPFDPNEYITNELTRDCIIELKEAFDMFDTGNTGTILAADLKISMENEGFKTHNQSIYNLIHNFHIDVKTRVDFKEFITLISYNQNDESTIDEIRILFNIFDVERKGFIELKNLRKIARELGESLNERELVELIRKSDIDGDGKVTFDDFYTIMNK